MAASQYVLRQFKTDYAFSRRKKTREKPKANPETKKQTEAQPVQNERGYRLFRAASHQKRLTVKHRSQLAHIAEKQRFLSS